MDNSNLNDINKMYEKLTYFDQYGASVILFIFITVILIIIIFYCYAKINAEPIINDWVNQRCKPTIIPFAGFINHPEGTTATEYTYQNFTYCTQNILSSITGNMIEPITYVINLLGSVVNDVKNAINEIRAMFDKIRTFFQTITQEIMGRIMNIMIPLQQIIISFKDLIGKIQGSMTTALFTLLGSYYTLKSFLGAIAQFIIIILIALAVMISIFWIIPFTWGAAIANTAIFVAISIPLAIMLAFMSDVLKVHTDLNIPSAPAGPSIKCFDEETLIVMNDGSTQKIKDIKLGEKLFKNNEVTSIIKVETKGSIMYNLYDVLVSDTHIVKYNNKWIPVSKHKDAVKVLNYNKPYLYCLNTANKTIVINNVTFTDWDEIYDDIDEIMEKNNTVTELKDIHKYLDGGFVFSTSIKLKNSKIKEIKNIEVGDILENGEKVYGIVQINGKNVSHQFEINLGNDKIIGGPNLNISSKNIDILSTLNLDKNNKKVKDVKENILYHLLTDTKTFTIGEIQFYDYNACIDLFLDKYRINLLSMKYV
jgi:hypothetical protein